MKKLIVIVLSLCVSSFAFAIDILVVDVDATIDSGPQIDAILQGLGYTTQYTNDFFAYDFTDYEYVFICLGMYPNDFEIDSGTPEEQACIDYLNANGNLYVEGGDYFGWTPPAALLGMYNISATADGSADLMSVMGEGDLAGLDLAYTGENNFVDHLEPTGDAFRILYNPADGAGCAVLDNSMTYHTATFSFELGMLVDTVDWTRADILSLVMAAFDSGVQSDPVNLYLTGTTTTVPQGGGNVVYDAHLVSDLPNAFTGVHYQTFVTIPTGPTLGPLMDITFTLAPFMNHSVTGMTLNVPGTAPQGGYIFEGRVGYPGTPYIVTDSFPFIKIGDGLSEDFDVDPAPGFEWFVGSSGTYMIDGGYAKIDVTAETMVFGSGAYTAEQFDNFSQSSTFELVQTLDYSTGLLFRGSGTNDGTYSGYAVYLSSGSWSAWEYLNGALTTNHVGWTADAAIQQGVGAINTLQVDASGNTFDVTCNGTYLGSFSDTNYTTGYVGFACAYDNEVWFDNLYCSHATLTRVAGETGSGQLETVLRDHMGRVITDPDDLYTPGVAFDRSAEFCGSFEFRPEDWVSGGSFIVAEDAGVVPLPSEFEMMTAYPNPFNPTTQLQVALPESGDLMVSVYNVLGQQVAVLAYGRYNSGYHNLTFDASNLASGLYFIRATIPGHLDQMQKVMLVR